MTRKTYAYLALFCLLSSLRDALWGKYLHIGSPLVSTSYSLLSGCLVTLFISTATGLSRKERLWDKLRRFSYPGGWRDFFLINLATVGAYYAYLLAISSPIGPGLASFVDYGLNPISTMWVAVIVLGVKWNRLLIFSMFMAMTGLTLFFVPRLSSQLTTDWNFLAGIGFAITSALLGGVFKVYSKKALDHGLRKAEVLFGRLVVLTAVLTLHVLIVHVPISLTQFVQLFVWGVFGFFAPLILFLNVLERLSMDSIALLLFSVPLLTYLASAALGLQQILASDLLAALLIFLAVYLHETRRRTNIASAPEPPIG